MLQAYVGYIFSSSGASTRLRFKASPYGASRSRLLDTPHSVGLLWTNDKSDLETSTRQNTTLTRDKQKCLRWIPTPNPTNPSIPAIQLQQTQVLTARQLQSVTCICFIKFQNCLVFVFTPKFSF
jgi:hypothetical protein